MYALYVSFQRFINCLYSIFLLIFAFTYLQIYLHLYDVFSFSSGNLRHHHCLLGSLHLQGLYSQIVANCWNPWAPPPSLLVAKIDPITLSAQAPVQIDTIQDKRSHITGSNNSCQLSSTVCETSKPGKKHICYFTNNPLVQWRLISQLVGHSKIVFQIHVTNFSLIINKISACTMHPPAQEVPQ